MNDTAKHAGGFLATSVSTFGAYRLEDINAWGSCACWIIGCIAGLCTIYSWWKSHIGKNRKHKH